MRTYCWKCKKQTRIEKPVESSRSNLLIRGNCEICGSITSKTVTRAQKLEFQLVEQAIKS